jgi:pSer/pThr/pTyr-binding forkhead associated (FHA) protein
VLEVTGDGALKGTRIELRGESASIGRGAHNDASLPDDSVSDSHARLERRDDGWYVMDAGSTNGTYVGGKRITGERRLDGPAELRFGGVTVAFRPAGAAKPAKGTRVLEARPTAAAAATPAPSESKKVGIPAWVWILVALVIAAGAYFVVKG